MNGAHDLGGMQGFGAIERFTPEPFSAQWEEKVFALTLACGMLGKWNIDQSRYAREQMDPAHYLSSSYYEHWLHGLELLLVETGLLTAGELDSGRPRDRSELQAVTADRVLPALRAGGPTLMQPHSPPRFNPGDRIRVRNFHPKSHTRAPRYVRGHEGEVVMHHGAHVFADVSAATGERQARHLYNVRFEAKELWGPDDTEGRSSVHVDLFEPYLEGIDD